MKRIAIPIAVLLWAVATCSSSTAWAYTSLATSGVTGNQFAAAIDQRFNGTSTIAPKLDPFPVASLPTEFNGTAYYATDGTPGTSPCTGGGTGALAVGMGGVFACLAAAGTAVNTGLTCNSGTTPCTVVAGSATWLRGDASTGNVTFNLPASSGTNKPISSCKIDSSANTVTMHRSGSDTISSAASDYVLTVQHQCVLLGDASAGNWSIRDERWPGGPPLQAGNNLSDLTSTATARTNLALGSAATANLPALGAPGSFSSLVDPVWHAAPTASGTTNLTCTGINGNFPYNDIYSGALSGNSVTYNLPTSGCADFSVITEVIEQDAAHTLTNTTSASGGITGTQTWTLGTSAGNLIIEQFMWFSPLNAWFAMSVGTNPVQAFPVPTGGTGRLTLTNHAVLAGAGTSAITQIGPDSSTGKPLISQGSSADPVYAAFTFSSSPNLMNSQYISQASGLTQISIPTGATYCDLIMCSGGAGGGGAGGDSNDTFDHNDVTRTNEDGVCYGQENGTKFSGSNGGDVISNNTFIANNAVGLWADVGENATFSNNTVTDNLHDGIRWETSHVGTINNNIVTNNAEYHADQCIANGIPAVLHTKAPCTGKGVGATATGCVGSGFARELTVINADSATVTSNTITSDCSGIVVVAGARAETFGNRVKSNSMTFNGLSTASGTPGLGGGTNATFPLYSDIKANTSDPTWLPSHSYALGSEIKDSNGNLERATSVSGSHTSGSGSHPTWPTTLGSTVTDNAGANQIVWTVTASNYFTLNTYVWNSPSGAGNNWVWQSGSANTDILQNFATWQSHGQDNP